LAGQETLRVRDNQGNTPLHHAVNYELCSEDQIKIVRALVAKSDTELKDASFVNIKGLSPYRYHEETHTEANNKVKKTQEIPQRGGGKESDRGGNQSRPEGSVMDDFGGQHQQDLRQYRLPPPMPNQGPPPLRPLQRVNTMSNAPPGKYGIGSSRTGAAQVDSPKIKSMVEINKEQVVGSTNDKTIAKRPTHKNRRPSKGQTKTNKNTKEETKPSPEAANEIKSFLKLHCLRTMKHDEAVDFLYGPSQGMCPIWTRACSFP
jgi:ankyrin repeat protein